MTVRPALLAFAAVALALPGCGRKDYPGAPDPARIAEPVRHERAQDDDPLLEPLPDAITPGPRLEERVDETLAD